jgi:HPt (histidine-containing phosphotransfer) domain-containing protein
MASPIDPKAIDELRSLNPGDDSFLRDLIQIFIEDSPQQIAEIELSLKQGDALRLTRAAHSLKGSCSNFGAGQLRAVSEKIERLGRAGSLGDVPAELPLVKAEFDRVKTALQDLVSNG